MPTAFPSCTLPTHHIEPPLVQLANDVKVLLGVKYSPPSVYSFCYAMESYLFLSLWIYLTPSIVN